MVPATPSGSGARPPEAPGVPTEERPVWTLGQALFVLAALAGGQGVLLLVVGVMLAFGATGWNAGGILLAALLGQYLLPVGAMYVVLRVRGIGFAEGLHLARLNIVKAIGLAMVATVFMRVVVSLITGIVLALSGTSEAPQVLDPTELFPPGIGGALAAIVVLGVAAPVVEEMVFRGALLDSVASRWGWRTGVVVSSLAFAGLHLNGWLLPGFFLLGAYLAWVRKATGSLWGSVFAHAAFNLGSIALAYALQGTGLV